MKFDVNAEKIYCNHCNKTIGRDDKFIFTHYLLNQFPNTDTNEPKCFCCTGCAKLDNPLLETFINDMVIKNRNRYMYSQKTVFFTDEIEFENERPRIIALTKAFNLFVNKYNYDKLYIELNTTLNKLKMRQEEQMED